MSLLDGILNFNKRFVAEKAYEPFLTNALPNKKLLILTCMDTRLVELLPRAMDFRNGDVKIIKNAGALVTHPFGSVMRSILVAVYSLDVHEIAVVGHHGCGMTGLSCRDILDKALAAGVSPDTITMLKHAGIELERWLVGFDQVQDGVQQSVEMIRTHPLLPQKLPVHGLIIHPETGKLDVVVDGYKAAGGAV